VVSKTIVSDLPHNVPGTKFFDVIRASIARQFKNVQERNEDDLPSILGGFDVLVQELIEVSDDLVSCFPVRFNIFQFFVLEYHRNIYSHVNHVITSVTDAGAILLLLKWARDYSHGLSFRLIDSSNDV
jgi:exocyst complex component 3